MKVVAWYDNEWGYSNRVVDLAQRVLCSGVTGPFGKKTLRDLEVERGPARARARRLQRAARRTGEVTDDTRIRAALPAIEQLRERGARIVVCSHLGRPEGARPGDLARAGVASGSASCSATRVHQAPEVIGPEVRRGAARLEPGEVLVLENTRWERARPRTTRRWPSSSPSWPRSS